MSQHREPSGSLHAGYEAFLRSALRTLVLLAALVALNGCGIECSFFHDENKAQCAAKYGEPQSITCYSDGRVVFTDRTVGEVWYGSSGTLYVSQRTNKHVRVTGQCMFEPAGER